MWQSSDSLPSSRGILPSTKARSVELAGVVGDHTVSGPSLFTTLKRWGIGRGNPGATLLPYLKVPCPATALAQSILLVSTLQDRH